MAEPVSDPYPRGEVPCSYHPNVKTGLRCTRCGKPICPKCAVRTPVGLRCPDCAGVRGLPTIRTSSSVLLRAGLAGLAVAALVAVLWYFGPQWKFYLSLALGFGVAEAMAKVGRGKRGRDLQAVALAIVVAAVIGIRLLLAWKYNIGLDQITAAERVIVPDGNRLVTGSALDFVQLRAIPDLLFIAMTCAIVWIRFR